MKIKPVMLNQKDFAVYGTVIGADECHVYPVTSPVSTSISIGYPREPVVKMLERHSDTTETSITLEGDAVVCFAAPAAEYTRPDETTIKAFIVKQGEVFVLHPGTWHCGAIPLNCEKCKSLVIFTSMTEIRDMEFRNLFEPVEIDLSEE